MAVSELSDYQACEHLIEVFERTFYKRYQTRLVRGGDEPLYLPAQMAGQAHQVIFARGFFNSALHELAHWCVAGEQRRQLQDYGYWYQPDGRSEAQQREFEQVEVLPQAYEQCFSWACGRAFHISADNLAGNPGDTSAFEAQVHQKTLDLLFSGQLRGRAKELFNALCDHWQRPFELWQQQAQQHINRRRLSCLDWVEQKQAESYPN